MKSSYLNIVSFVIFSLIIGVPAGYTQDTSKDKKLANSITVKQEVEDTNFVFVASSVNPANGALRQLTEYYSIKVKNDSLNVDLPYFGRSYTAPVDPTNISINFTSVNFEYSVTNLKKGGWDILIKPKDQTEIQSILISAYDNGTAYVNVTSTNRSPISYNGYLEDKK